MTASSSAPGALVLDRYRLEAPLAAVRPGFGAGGEQVEAWLGEDAERGARVEVHLLPATPVRERAFAQVRATIERLAGLPGRALARPLRLEWGEDGRLVLVLEYHDGRALSTLLANRPSRPDEAREVLRGLLHALALAARAGLTHGRLSPARVLLGAENQVALLDLGLEPLLEPDEGEAPWRAPGQARGARADAFAIAALARELLTGQRPTRGQPLAPVPVEAAAAVGPAFLDAVERLLRADGSAQVFDAGALLGLLPPRQGRARRSRYTLSEVWDGDIGSGTARLMKLAVSPEYERRMPEEIRGQAGPADQPPGERDELQFLSTLPGVFVAPRPAPVVEPAPPAPPPPAPPPAAPAPAPPAPTPEDDPARTLPPSDVRATPAGWGSATAPQARTVVLPRVSPPEPQPTVVTAPPEPGPAPRSSAPPRPAPPLLLRAGRAPQAVFLIPGTLGQARLGRERGNDLVLRAFRGQEVDGVDSNRISRRHLTVSWSQGRFELTDEKSTYGTSLDGRRLPPGGPTALPGGAFALQLGEGVLAFRGRAWPELGALRLTREDATGHVYLLLLGSQGTPLRVGSAADDDPLLLPAEGGVRPGHALLRADPRSGHWQIGAGEGPVSAGGANVPRGAWTELIGVQLGQVRLGARTLTIPYDFFSPVSGLAV